MHLDRKRGDQLDLRRCSRRHERRRQRPRRLQRQPGARPLKKYSYFFFVVLYSGTRSVWSTLLSFCTVRYVVQSCRRIKPGQLSEKNKRYLCAMPPTVSIYFTFDESLTNVKFPPPSFHSSSPLAFLLLYPLFLRLWLLFDWSLTKGEHLCWHLSNTPKALEHKEAIVPVDRGWWRNLWWAQS